MSRLSYTYSVQNSMGDIQIKSVLNTFKAWVANIIKKCTAWVNCTIQMQNMWIFHLEEDSCVTPCLEVLYGWSRENRTRRWKDRSWQQWMLPGNAQGICKTLYHLLQIDIKLGLCNSLTFPDSGLSMCCLFCFCWSFLHNKFMLVQGKEDATKSICKQNL